MAEIANCKAVLRWYEEKSEQVQKHFAHLPKLFGDDLPYEITLAYAFRTIEQAQNRALYGGAVKVWSRSTDATRSSRGG